MVDDAPLRQLPQGGVHVAACPTGDARRRGVHRRVRPVFDSSRPGRPHSAHRGAQRVRRGLRLSPPVPILPLLRPSSLPARRARPAPAAAALLALALLATASARPLRAQPSAPSVGAAAPPLLPAPREIASRPSLAVGAGVSVSTGADADDRFAAATLRDALRERGARVLDRGHPDGVLVRLLRADGPDGRDALRQSGLTLDSAMRAEGYVLVTEARPDGNGRVDVVAASAAGLYYGAQTVAQLVAPGGTRLLGARIRDWPAMRWRGLHDDLSRGPVPTLAYQKRQIRVLAAHKMNVYSPYFEHTFAYASHPVFAPPGGAMTPAEARELAAFARRHHVEIIPEQQTFGHLHQVLKWERYTPAGESPRSQAFAAGDSAAIAFARATFAELDSAFPGRVLHIGGDETFELGRGRSAERVAREGLGAVYVDHVRRVSDALRPLGRRLMLWGDLGTNHPELVGTLPRDLIVVPWVYDRLPSYDRWIAPFTGAGFETWAAPGVSNWWRLYPNYAIGFDNVRGVARDAQRLGAAGLLVTTWDDFGEQLFEQTWAGVLLGAAAAWQPGAADADAFLDAYARGFVGDTSGHVVAAERALMAAATVLGRAAGTEMQEQLFWADPWSAEGQRMSARILPVARELRLHTGAAIERLVRARAGGTLREPDVVAAMELGARRLDWLALHFQLADDAAGIYGTVHAAGADSARAARVQWFDLADVSGINGRLQDLRDGYGQLRDLYEAAWRRENRPYYLTTVLARYDQAMHRWIERIDRINGVRAEWARTRRVPAPEAIGLPPAGGTSAAPGGR